MSRVRRSANDADVFDVFFDRRKVDQTAVADPAVAFDVDDRRVATTTHVLELKQWLISCFKFMDMVVIITFIHFVFVKYI